MATEYEQLVINRLMALKNMLPHAEQNMPVIMTMGGQVLTIDQMIAEIRASTPTGRSYVENEVRKLVGYGVV